MPSLTTRRIRVRGHLALLSSCAMVAFGLGIAAVSAQTNGPEVFVADPETSGIRSAAPAEMVAQARERGGIRVIVGFDLEMGLEGEMSSAEVGRQRGEISTGQERILGGLSSPGNVTRYDAIPYMALELSADDLEALFRMPGITSVRETFGAQINLDSSASHINANRIWPQTDFGAGQYVAVLDTGLAYNHVAFEDRFDYSACYNTTNIFVGSETLCPNGQDVHLGPRSARDCGTIADDPIFGCGHGTHVSGIAMGDRPNRRGVAPGANVIPMNVFSRVPNGLTAFNDDLISALERVLFLKNNRDVPVAAANMSLGLRDVPFEGTCDDYDPAVTAVMEQLRSHGVATISSSGNDGFDGAIGWPSCISSAIAVGSTLGVSSADGGEPVSSFSNHAPTVDLMAPGQFISAPDIHGGPAYVGTKSGTSMAAPHVAGAWALLRSEKPEASVDEIHRALACSGISNGAMATRANLAKPRINVAAARNFLRDDSGRNDERVWDFRHPAQVENQWQQTGDWEHVGNRMTVSGDQSGIWKGALSAFCGSSVTVNARIRVSDTGDDGTYWNSGLRLSVQQDENANAAKLWFAVSESNGGTAVIWVLDGADQEMDGGENARLLCDNADISASFDPDGWNALRAVHRGGQQSFYVNGELVCESAEPSHPVGYAGVGMYHAEGQAERVFDLARFVVRQHDSAPVAASATLVAVSADISVARGGGGAEGFESAPAGGSLEVPAGSGVHGVQR